jgi:hypothetical protein
LAGNPKPSIISKRLQSVVSLGVVSLGSQELHAKAMHLFRVNLYARAHSREEDRKACDKGLRFQGVEWPEEGVSVLNGTVAGGQE